MPFKQSVEALLPAGIHALAKLRPRRKDARSTLQVLLAGVVLTSVLGAQVQPGQQRAEQMVVLALQPHGFEQPSVTIPAGRTLIVFKNRTYIENVQVRLDRAAGPLQREVALQKARRTWRDVVELTPGDYTLTVVGVPKWRCQITVKATR